MDMTTQGKDYEYATLMNMLHVSVSKHLLDEHFTMVWANSFYYDLIGYPKEEYEALYHNHCDTYYVNDALGIHDDKELAELTDAVMKALSTGRNGYTLTSRMRRKSGEYIWVQMTATFTDEYIDGRQVSYTVMTDVTESMQQRIEQTAAYDNLPGFVAKYRIDPEMHIRIMEVNSQFNTFFGAGSSRIDTAAVIFQNNLKQNEEVIRAHRQELTAGKPVHFVIHVENSAGKTFWLQVNASCVDRQGGDFIYLAIFIDITNETELRSMQEKLEQQARELQQALELAEHASRAKTDFLSHMSHDIRTPMNAIVGMTDIAKAHLNEPEKMLDCLGKIELSSRHLLGLINDVLDMSRIENGNIAINTAPVSLPELLENVVTITQPSIKAREQQFAVQLHHVRHERYCSDALRLRQILINLLSNASKFTPSGGAVTVDIEEFPGAAPAGTELRIRVADTGIGMSAGYLKHIFDPFSREQDSRVDKTEGSGLGMAITKRLVELLGGSIEVQSEVGVGTTFVVRLPMEIDDTATELCRFPELKVLVVDDGAYTLEYLEQLLGELQVKAECTSSGADAVEKVVRASREGRDYDAVILDWKMPELDGLHTAERIREKVGRQFPILIMSAYDWSDIEDVAKRAGVNGFLQKPIFRSTLCYGIKRYVLQQKAEKSVQPTYDFSGKRLLLVEDNELNREIAVELLQRTGAIVDTACNGKQGIERFENVPEGHYALILMDIQMPVMDGLAATRVIRALSRADAATVPIIAMTADAFAEDVVAAKQAGMTSHLAKPIDVAELYRVIQACLA